MRYYHIMKKVSCGRYRGPMTGKKLRTGSPTIEVITERGIFAIGLIATDMIKLKIGYEISSAKTCC